MHLSYDCNLNQRVKSNNKFKRWMDIQTDGKAGEQMDRRMGRRAKWWTDKWVSRWTDGQAGKVADRRVVERTDGKAGKVADR